jgi:hypothetical protein
MADYKERFDVMKAAQDAMRVSPRTPAAEATSAAQSKSSEKAPSKQAMQEAMDAAIRAREEKAPTTKTEMGKKKGGCIKMAKGGTVKSSASKRADGIAQRGKTRGKMV